MQNSIALQKKLHAGSSLIAKAFLFIKKSLLISLIFATVLYSLMRVFFIGADFDMTESIELYVKTFLITWSYINAWRLICHGIIWLETKTSKVSFRGVFNMQVMKRAAILIVAAGLAYKVRANPSHKVCKCTTTECSIATAHEIIPQFYLWTK